MLFSVCLGLEKEQQTLLAKPQRQTSCVGATVRVTKATEGGGPAGWTAQNDGRCFYFINFF